MKEGKPIEVRRGSGRGRVLGAFVIGATAGSALALLFAPASGRVTRKRIGLKLRAIQRDTVRHLGQTTRLLARKADTLREDATKKLSNAREWVVEHVANGHPRRPVHHHA